MNLIFCEVSGKYFSMKIEEEIISVKTCRAIKVHKTAPINRYQINLQHKPQEHS